MEIKEDHFSPYMTSKLEATKAAKDFFLYYLES